MKRKAFILLLCSLLLGQFFIILPSVAVDITSSSISPNSFSPDGNSLNDTTTITILSPSSGQTLYTNFFNQTSFELVAEDKVMTESPIYTYKYTWNGKDNSNVVVPQGTYTIRISDNPSQNGDTIGTVDVDLTPPSSPSLSIAGGSTYTTTRSVTLTISATGATQMKISNSASYSGATWETYATTKSWQLSANDGTKTVYINFRNAVGTNISTTDTITLDTTLADPALSINSGASSTSSRNVTLTITANDATYMKIDNNTNFQNMSSWISKSSSHSFRLPSGADGVRSVYLRVKDDAGNVKTTSDTITLDTTAPSNLSLSINDGDAYTNSTIVTLAISASSGPAYMYFSNTGSSYTGYTYAASKTWTLASSDGTKTVYYKAADSAGNNATAITASIILDTSAPSAVQLLSPTNGGTVSTQTPTLSWSDPNPSGTKNFYVELLQSGNVIETSSCNSSTTSYTTSTLSAGSYSWQVTVYDMANNSAITSQYSFTISVTGLAIPTPSLPANGARVNDTTPTLKWSLVTGAEYRVRYSLSEDTLDEQPLYSTASTSYPLPSGYCSNGQTVYWQVQAHNTESGSTDFSTVRSFTIDTQKPTGLTISINSGSTYTSSATVTLSLSATGATMMMISNYADFTGSSWETYATSKSWTLLSNNGNKTVYFKAKDNAVNGDDGGSAPNINSSVNDYIILDSTAPLVNVSTPSSGGTTSTTTNLVIRAVLYDIGSGINTTAVTMSLDDVSIDIDDLIITTALVQYTASTIAEGTHTVNVTATDYAGYTGYRNWSFTVEEENEETPPPGGGAPVDSPPTISGISRSPTIVTNSDTVTISATVTDDSSITSVDLFWNDSSLHSKQMTVKTGNIYNTTIGPFAEGKQVSYYLMAIDDASQAATSSTYTFTVTDATAPTISVISPTDGLTIYDRLPTIEATYSDTGGIDITTVALTLDDINITSLATITSSSITYLPTTQLSYKEYTVKLDVSDLSGNTATKTWTFTVQVVETSMAETIEEIAEGETQTVTFEEYDSALGTILITAATDLENVIISCQITGEKPQDVTTPENTLYMYLIISTNVGSDDISSATINFKVEKQWLEDTNVDKSTVKLVRYANGWQELTTTLVNEDATYVYYEAVTTGFSVFAIVGEPVETQTQPLTIYIAIIGVIIAVILATIVILFKKGYLYMEQKSEENTEQTKEK